ncbi:hypothetical protein [Lysinibacillus sphaericus]|uniref:hypothetical protein n=1 Tax=Lysinibacillus sphaericus TaxID=1421 RepID=UPI00248CBDFC|nr:hypothetical protein [Lysinibacillus sphaericus]
MSEKSLTISIKDIKLKQVDFQEIESRKNEKEIMEYTVDIPEDKIKNIDVGFQIKLFSEFEVHIDSTYVKGKVESRFVILDSTKPVVKRLIKKQKYQLSFPIVAKICTLIAKVTEEMNAIPLVISPKDWIEMLEDEVEEDNE